jgi:hypothetical protein
MLTALFKDGLTFRGFNIATPTDEKKLVSTASYPY